MKRGERIEIDPVAVAGNPAIRGEGRWWVRDPNGYWWRHHTQQLAIDSTDSADEIYLQAEDGRSLVYQRRGIRSR